MQNIKHKSEIVFDQNRFNENMEDMGTVVHEIIDL